MGPDPGQGGCRKVGRIPEMLPSLRTHFPPSALGRALNPESLGALCLPAHPSAHYTVLPPQPLQSKVNLLKPCPDTAQDTEPALA